MKNRSKHIVIGIIFLISILIGFLLSQAIIRQEKAMMETPYYIHPWKSAQVIYGGDTSLYKCFVDSIRKRTPQHPDYFTYSVYMANHFNYLPAYFDVYNALKDVYSLNNLGEMDSLTFNMAMYYLCTGAKKGNAECVHELSRMAHNRAIK